MNDARICTRGKIWDLHIHSHRCFSADKSIRDMSDSDYIDGLLSVAKDYQDLEMISFTDHNCIHADLYREFYNRSSSLVLLPGIEVDVALEEGGVSKHLIVYFDAIGDIARLDKLASNVNELLESRSTSAHNPIGIDLFLGSLIDYGVPFVLSPHAMKQDKRGIDVDWHVLPAEERDTDKYLDQFFCFWESGHSAIAHAIDFLRQMDREERISIVSFSDSKSFEGLRGYLNAPWQYFNALPNFNGIKLAGTEITRITRKQTTLPNDLGCYIGKVEIAGQTIDFSPQLNAIIGGRGSGKSVLLDSIANYLDPTKGNLSPKRRGFISSVPIAVTSMTGTSLPQGSFRFDYYDQSYISSLFDKDGDAFNDAIESYFESTFSQVPIIDANTIELQNRATFNSLVHETTVEPPDNITSLVEKFIANSNDKLNLRVHKNGKRPIDSEIDELSYQALSDALDVAIRDVIPTAVDCTEDIENAITRLKIAVLEAAYQERYKHITGDSIYNGFIDLFVDKRKALSDAQREREAVLDRFEKAFAAEAHPIEKRVAIINAYIEMAAKLKRHHVEAITVDGERKEAFQFKHELFIEHPFDYMIRMFSNHLYALPNRHVCNRENLWEYVEAFCYDKASYKQESSWSKLYDDLKSFRLRYSPSSSICYLQENGAYEDISTMSPGTQTNILIEYIVHKDEDRPLLIDQPEDNVDNQTIYEKIRTWFMSLKHRRQVIVVTHDANIVVNADAENVIHAEQATPGRFVYDYGALEYGDTIDHASLILDGGKDAVRRRLVKYGE